MRDLDLEEGDEDIEETQNGRPLPDYTLSAGENPHPDGPGWKLSSYNFYSAPYEEIGRFKYVRDDGTRIVVDVPQPLDKHYETMRASYFKRLQRRLRRQQRQSEASAR